MFVTNRPKTKNYSPIDAVSDEMVSMVLFRTNAHKNKINIPMDLSEKCYEGGDNGAE